MPPSLYSDRRGHEKVEMIRFLHTACPRPVPETQITASDKCGIGQILDQWRFPLVAPSVRSSQGMGVYLIKTRPQRQDYVARKPVPNVQRAMHMHDYLLCSTLPPALDSKASA